MTDKVAIIYSDEYTHHDTGAHVESPERGPAIQSALLDAPFAHKLDWVEPHAATVQQIALVHESGYISFVENSCNRTGGGIAHLNPDTAVCGRSYDVALLAAGGVLNGIDLVLDQDAAHFFAVVRPPGHHAEFSESLGFCLFNNIAIGARYAIEEKGLERVFILDWDVHHGNGTQHSLEADSQVFFSSFHQSPHYPGTGRINDYGRDHGIGTTLNFPMPAGSGNDDYMYLMHEILIPAIKKFQPQLMLVSAGFDAHSADPLSNIELTEDAYAAMTEALLDAAPDVPVGLVLEGGYNLRTLASSAAAATGVLTGEKPVAVFGQPSTRAVSIAENHLSAHPWCSK